MSILFDDTGPERLTWNSILDFAGFPISLAAWVKVDDSGINGCAVSHGDAAANNDSWSILTNSSGNEIFRRAQAGNTDVGGGAITQDAWTFLGVTQTTATDIGIYRDFNEILNTATDRQPGPGNRVAVGAMAILADSFPFSGRLFWPAIWNVSFSKQEFFYLASGASPRTVRREALKFFGQDRAGGEMIDVIGHNFVDEVIGPPAFSTDNPFQAQRLGARGRTRSRTRLFAA